MQAPVHTPIKQVMANVEAAFGDSYEARFQAVALYAAVQNDIYNGSIQAVQRFAEKHGIEPADLVAWCMAVIKETPNKE